MKEKLGGPGTRRGKGAVLAAAICAILIMSGMAPPTEAGLLLYDGFDYTQANLLTKTDGGTGFTGAWQQVRTGDAKAMVVPGLSFSNLAVTGNAVGLDTYNTQKVNPDGYTHLYLSRQIANGASTGSTLWSSFLWKCDAGQTRWYSASNIGVAGTTGVKPARYSAWTGAKFDQGDTGQYVWGKNIVGVSAMEEYWTSTDISPPSSNPTHDGNTYLFVAKWTNVGGAGYNSTLWMLNESDFNAIKDGGITEAELNANYRRKVSRSDGTWMTGLTFNPGDFLTLYQFNTSRANNQPWGSWDELRYGVGANPTDAGIFPLQLAPVPEPGAMVLLGLGGLCLLANRRFVNHPASTRLRSPPCTTMARSSPIPRAGL